MRERGELTSLDSSVITSLIREQTLTVNVERDYDEKVTLKERAADAVAGYVGSWGFIFTFVGVMMLWIGSNVWLASSRSFDPYPFILLNLMLSLVAALQAPLIMMSQRRQETKDRLRSQNDYQVNLKAELEIRHLHEKLDHHLLRHWERLTEIQQMQLDLLDGAIESATSGGSRSQSKSRSRPPSKARRTR